MYGVEEAKNPELRFDALDLVRHLDWFCFWDKLSYQIQFISNYLILNGLLDGLLDGLADAVNNSSIISDRDRFTPPLT